MRVRLIFNPAAGKGRAERIYQRLAGELEHRGIEVCRTEYPGHAGEFSRELAQDPDATVVSLGGDGTHQEIVNGLMPAPRCTLGLIPAGTGNDFARRLHLPARPTDCLRVALEGKRSRWDVGRVGERYFLTVAGVGFDAEVAKWANEHGAAKYRGAWVFILGVLRKMWGYRCEVLTVRLPDGSLRRRPTFLLAAANTPQYAGGMQICPGASPEDGKLTVVWIGALHRREIFPLLAGVFSGRHLRHPAAERFEVDRLTVEGPPGLWVHADGELVGHLPVDLTVVPAALWIRHG